jgi:hypothetical protein
MTLFVEHPMTSFTTVHILPQTTSFQGGTTGVMHPPTTNSAEGPLRVAALVFLESSEYHFPVLPSNSGITTRSQ